MLGGGGAERGAAGLGASVSLLRPCATSAGFLATRDPPWRMDMAGLKGRLAGSGYAIVIDARVVLIVRKATPLGPVESSVYDNGKVLLIAGSGNSEEMFEAGTFTSDAGTTTLQPGHTICMRVQRAMTWLRS